MLSYSSQNLFCPPPVNPDSVEVVPALSGSGLGVDSLPVSVLQISQFRHDFPWLAARLESMREACGDAGSDVGAGAAEGVPEFVTPPSNTGVNKTLSLAQGTEQKEVSA